MSTRALLRAALALAATASWLGFASSPALAIGEFDRYDVESVSSSLTSTQAGAHADLSVGFSLTQKGGEPFALTRDFYISLPAGMIGNLQHIQPCTLAQFGEFADDSECPVASQVGVSEVTLGGNIAGSFTEPIYNLQLTGDDLVARLGVFAGPFPVLVNVRLDPTHYNLIAAIEGAPSVAGVIATENTLWGVPAAPSHDSQRLTVQEATAGETPAGGRPAGVPEVPFMTNPTECSSGRRVSVTAVSYQLPDQRKEKSAPFPQITGCGLLGFNPSASLEPTTSQAASGAGLDYEASLPTGGIEVANVLYDSELKRAEVALPEGLTLNPSAAEGLGVCSEADLARETYDSGPNAGCPESSKIGNVSAISPVIDHQPSGSLYLAKSYENPFGSLLALYLVLKVPDRGVLVKLAGEVHPDPNTGQLVTTFDDVPQLPVASFHLHFREGARAPLITPRTCGSYVASSKLSPWSDPAAPLARPSVFAIESGPDHGPCPPAGAPFEPGFAAGTDNNLAGAFSPVSMGLTRRDGDQDLTKFSATLPPGLAGVLAGVSQCSDAAIAQARSRTGQNGGHEEQQSPSCPPSSEIGHVLAGAGVGSVLTYVKGHVYLAGPYHGAPLSVVGIVPAVAGPFDVGTVVTRQALRVDPRSGQVQVDGANSDPIPHILAGIPLTVRDIRVNVDRPRFTFNPTSCEPMSVDAKLWGGGENVFSTLDDSPHSLAERFQAADCAALGFKPRLAISLRGGTRRGGHPALRGVYRPRKGDANLSKLVLRLPHSAFLDQAHIRTICTRVQFAANGGNGGGCPKGAVYGHAVAYTPILDKPLEGPVYLRSSNHNLPDFVAALHGLVDVEAVARIDSVHGGIRATFSGVPDAPLTKVAVHMQGAKKGLIVNSKNLCSSANKATAQFEGQNGKTSDAKPVVKPDCAKNRKGRGKKR